MLLLKKKLQRCWGFALCLALVPAICVSKLPHLSCPNPKRTSCDVPTPPKRKRLQILEVEKADAEKTIRTRIGYHNSTRKIFLGSALFHVSNILKILKS
jgi:hypothetical protein